MLSVDGQEKVSIELESSLHTLTSDFGSSAAKQLLANGGNTIAEKIRNTAK